MIRGKLRLFIRESRIVRFLSGLPINIMASFCESGTRRAFKGFLSLVRRGIFANADKSILVSSAKKTFKGLGLRDLGLFIMAVTVFHTILVLAEGGYIDGLSAAGRSFAFSCGAIIFLRKKRKG
ncbi:MAG: hypothetical protein WC515_07150 [Candidatus Omnitrophota bacterium]